MLKVAEVESFPARSKIIDCRLGVGGESRFVRMYRREWVAGPGSALNPLWNALARVEGISQHNKKMYSNIARRLIS